MALGWPGTPLPTGFWSVQRKVCMAIPVGVKEALRGFSTLAKADMVNSWFVGFSILLSSIHNGCLGARPILCRLSSGPTCQLACLQISAGFLEGTREIGGKCGLVEPPGSRGNEN